MNSLNKRHQDVLRESGYLEIEVSGRYNGKTETMRIIKEHLESLGYNCTSIQHDEKLKADYIFAKLIG